MKTFGLIGSPLSHSFSKSYFEQKFIEGDYDYQYLNYELNTIKELPLLVAKNPEIVGLNVTIPYKQQVIRFLDHIEKEARFIGAVNTIKFERTAKNTILTGYNTDAMGFELLLKQFLKTHHKKALVLGTGGAARAIEFVLRKYGINAKEVSRRPLKSNQMSYGLINKQVIEEHLIIINTTPLGMSPKADDSPDIPYKFLGENHLLIDLVYNPSETQFLKKGKANGATTVNGLSMLHSQADQSWEIWNS